MAAPSPLTSLTAESHPLGNEIDLNWEVPTSLPAQYRVDIFRKEGADITQEEIDQIMGGTPVDGVDLFQPGNEYHGMHDMQVEDGKTYYYRGIVVNTDTNEYSTSVGDSAVPDWQAAPDVVDLKDLVLEAVRRVFRSREIVIDKDVHIKKSHNVEFGRFPVVTVTRDPSSIYQKFIGDYVGDDQLAALGDVERDVVTVIWSDVIQERRDKLTLLFRSAKQEIKRFLMRSDYGIAYLEITFGGDTKDDRFQNEYVAANSMTVQALIQCIEEFEPTEEKGYPLEVEPTPISG